MARVPASLATRKRIEQMMSGVEGEGFRRTDFVREAVRLMVEEALEAEVSDALGRAYYQHGANERGYRNGYRTGKLKSAEGTIEFGVPQVTGTAAPFSSTLKAGLAGRSEELERVAIEMYARGLSVRDIEAAFTDRAGRCQLSRSAVSALTGRLWEDYLAFASRDLAEHQVLYLFLDGIAERLHLGQPREAVLAAWGITAQGNKVLLGLTPGSKESTACVREFLRDLVARGLHDPLLVITDGAPGLMAAVEQCLPKSLRQRCLAHRMRNLEGKVPAERWREVKAMAVAAYQAASPALAQMLKEEFTKRWERELPATASCFVDDFDACIAHQRLPIAHRRAIRTTNLLERLFGEERRRTKVIPHAFGEKAVMKLMYASLIRAATTWKRMVISEFELKQIEQLREQLDEEFKQQHQPLSATASHQKLSSKNRT